MKQKLQNLSKQSDSETMNYFESIKFTLKDDVSPFTNKDYVSYALLSSLIKRFKNILILPDENIIDLERFQEYTP